MRPPIRTATTYQVSGLPFCSRSRTPLAEVAMETLICSRYSLWLLLVHKSKVSSTVLLISRLSSPSTTFFTDWVAYFSLFFALSASTSYEPTRKLPFDTTTHQSFRLTVLFPILTNETPVRLYLSRYPVRYDSIIRPRHSEGCRCHDQHYPS